MKMTKRWMTLVGAVAIVGTLLGGVALAEKTPDAKATKEYKKPAPSAGSVALQQQLEDLYKAHMAQLSKEALVAIDQAAKDGKISEKEAAWYRHKYETPAAPKVSHAQLEATLAQMVKDGKITQENANQKLAGFDKEQASKKAPAAPEVTRAQLEATLAQMVKDGKITQEHANQKLAGYDQAQAKKK